MKTVIVTGGSGGIGKQISYDFAKENFFVVVHYYKDKKSADKIVKDIISFGGNATSFCADLSKLSEAERLFHRLQDPKGNQGPHSPACAGEPYPLGCRRKNQ